jgi:hypothetical protein
MRALSHLPILGILWLAGCGASPVDVPDPQGGTLRATVTTIGAGAKPSQLQLLLGNGQVMQINANGRTDVDELPVGSLTARVVVPGHCAADHYAPRTATIEAGGVAELAWSIRCLLPMAPGIVFEAGIGTHELWVAEHQDGPIRKLETPWVASATSPVANPARTRIAYTGRGADNLPMPHIMDTYGSNDITLPWRAASMDWSPDGSRLAMLGDGRILVVWADGVLHSAIEDLQSPLSTLRWSPGGNQLAFRAGAYIYVHDLTTGIRTNTNRILNVQGGGHAWSPDGNRLAFIDRASATIWTMGADGSNPQPLLSAGTLGQWIDWHPNGQLLFAIEQYETGEDVLRTMPATGGSPTVLQGFPPWISSGRWAP